MSWVAIGVGLGTAVVGGVASQQSAKAANKSKTVKTDQTTAQTPYGEDLIGGDIENLLALQRSSLDRGVPQIGPGGVSYAPIPGRGGAATAPDVPQGYARRPDGRIVPVVPNPRGARGGRGGAPRTAGAGTAASNSPAAPPPASAEDIFREAAERGFAAGDSSTIRQGREGIGNVLGAAGGGGPETTGFDRYNPINDALARDLLADQEDQAGRDALLRFLAENGRGSAGSAASGDGAGGSGAEARVNYAVLNPQVFGPGAAAAGAGGVPDTMAGEGFFQEQTRRFFDEPANDAELAALIQAMEKEVMEGHWEGLADLDAAAQGAGRFGGDTWQAARAGAQEELGEALAGQSAQVRVGDRESRRAARLAALSGVNTRDLAAMQNATQREGIAAGERASAAAAGASGASAAAARELGLRGQDLQALGMLLDTEQFGTGTLAGLGERLSLDRLASMGMIPGLEGIGLSGLDAALGGGQGLLGGREIASRERIAGQQANVARQGMNLDAARFNAGQQRQALDDYMRTILGIGGLGGTSRTTGTNVQPGLGVSTTGAALTGALGGGLAGYGAAAGYR